jgi:hypothetical protein
VRKVFAPRRAVPDRVLQPRDVGGRVPQRVRRRALRLPGGARGCAARRRVRVPRAAPRPPPLVPACHVRCSRFGIAGGEWKGEVCGVGDGEERRAAGGGGGEVGPHHTKGKEGGSHGLTGRREWKKNSVHTGCKRHHLQPLTYTTWRPAKTDQNLQNNLLVIYFSSICMDQQCEYVRGCKRWVLHLVCKQFFSRECARPKEGNVPNSNCKTDLPEGTFHMLV